MSIVAIAASGRIFLAAGDGQAMDTGAVGLGLSLVAMGAIWRPGSDIIVRVFGGNVAVTTGASVGFVNGGGKFGLVDEKRNPLPCGVGLIEGFIGMAFETGAVFDFLREEVGLQPAVEKEHRSDRQQNHRAALAHTKIDMARGGPKPLHLGWRLLSIYCKINGSGGSPSRRGSG